MASLFIALAPGVNRSGVVVPHSRPRISGEAEVTAETAVLQIGGADAQGADGEFWFLTARGADVIIAVGSDPDAEAGPGHLCPAGIPMVFPVTKVGEMIAGVTAA